ncbi:hypothetical protein SAMN02745248_00031 [Hathewaya proteolytica DSM 3090]|uniref:Coat F domain-containing protein n=1 Tax=Hathewaya proteolytica DSM 3090 TaxID=1121331 RepID=A0A1M6J3J6_9CLOT|nr:hypothetical protein [Hathewaya proteolytica]SHJ41290.1 hypothetical protein SAMN02745248_00031 [Hathewaya proteolytica DSM 3090]
MCNLSMLDLQNLRHLIGAHASVEKKLNAYAEKCTDSQIKQTFLNHANDSKQTKDELITFLG